jgi:hypothetical protein
MLELLSFQFLFHFASHSKSLRRLRHFPLVRGMNKQLGLSKFYTSGDDSDLLTIDVRSPIIGNFELLIARADPARLATQFYQLEFHSRLSLGGISFDVNCFGSDACFGARLQLSKHFFDCFNYCKTPKRDSERQSPTQHHEECQLKRH